MKYESPKYELTVISCEDILAGSAEANYTIEQSGDGSGDVIMNAFDLFN